MIMGRLRQWFDAGASGNVHFINWWRSTSGRCMPAEWCWETPRPGSACRASTATGQ